MATTSTAKSMGIAWGRVLAIAAVQAALSLMWITYNAYLGDLLGNWGFSETFARNLLTAEVLLALVMEPIFGLLSDQQQRFLGSRAPLIVLGVISSAALFVLLPLVAALNISFTWILPLVAIAWSLAMTTFRTPIYVLLLKSAPMAELPLAMAILAMLGGLIGLARGSIKTLILGWGPLPAFLIGSITLLTASTFLKFFMPPLVPPAEDQPKITPAIPWNNLGRTALMAIALTWGPTILTGNLKGIFNGGAFGADTKLMPLLSLGLTLIAIPAAWFARKWNKYPLMAIALGYLSLMLIVLLATPSVAALYVLVAALWIAASAIVKNGTLPHIFATVPGRWAGFAIGVYFGTAGVARNLFPRIFPEGTQSIQGLAGICALAIAAGLAIIPFLPKPNQTEELSNEVE